MIELEDFDNDPLFLPFWLIKSIEVNANKETTIKTFTDETYRVIDTPQQVAYLYNKAMNLTLRNLPLAVPLIRP